MKLILSVLFSLIALGPAIGACCNSGCCDCSCVSLQLEKRASTVAKSIEANLKAKGAVSVESFTVTVDDTSKSGPARPWKCAAQTSGATCTRQP